MDGVDNLYNFSKSQELTFHDTENLKKELPHSEIFVREIANRHNNKIKAHYDATFFERVNNNEVSFTHHQISIEKYIKELKQEIYNIIILGFPDYQFCENFKNQGSDIHQTIQSIIRNQLKPNGYFYFAVDNHISAKELEELQKSFDGLLKDVTKSVIPGHTPSWSGYYETKNSKNILMQKI